MLASTFYKPQLNEKKPAEGVVLKEMLQSQANEDATAKERRIVESRNRNLEESAEDLSIKKVRITKFLQHERIKVRELIVYMYKVYI